MSVFAIGRTREVGTLADGLAEPSDLLVDGPELVVVESAAHRLVRLPLPARTRDLGAPPPGRRGRTRTGYCPGAVHAAAGTASRPPVRRAHVVDGHRQEWLLDVRPVAGGATEIVLSLTA